jgi:hypothetical protein
MAWREILLVFIRCELQARYNDLTGWQISAKGALPVILLTLGAGIAWFHG